MTQDVCHPHTPEDAQEESTQCAEISEATSSMRRRDDKADVDQKDEDGADEAAVDKTDEKGDSALSRAAMHGDLEVVKSLLKKRAAINQKNRQGETPLFCAVAAEHIHEANKDCAHALVVKELLDQGADVINDPPSPRPSDGSGNTQGTFSATCSRVLSHASTMKLKDSGGNSAFAAGTQKRRQGALHIAAFKGCNACLEALLEKGAETWCDALAEVNKKAEHGVTQLLRMEAGGNQTATPRVTPLHLAASGRVVETLLRNRATITEEDGNGNTPLHYAVAAFRRGSFKVVKKLLDHDNSKGLLLKENNAGATPLHLAASGKVAETLLLHGRTVSPLRHDKDGVLVWPFPLGKDINEVGTDIIISDTRGIKDMIMSEDKEGRKPLHYAAKQHAWTEMQKALEAEQMEVQDCAVDEDFNSGQNYAQVVKRLLQCRAQVGAETSEGATPLDVVHEDVDDEVLKTLVEAGATFHTKDGLVRAIKADRQIFVDVVDKLLRDTMFPNADIRMSSELRTAIGDPSQKSKNPLKNDLIENKALKDLFFGKRVRCKTMKLDCPLDVIGDKDVVAAIAETPCEEMLATETANAILDHAWEKVRLHFYVHLAIQVASVVAVAMASRCYREQQDPVSMQVVIILIFSVAVKVLTEVGEFLHTETSVWWPVKRVMTIITSIVPQKVCWLVKRVMTIITSIVLHLIDPRNIVDLAMIWLRIVGTQKLLQLQADPYSKCVVALFCAMQWLTFLYSCRSVMRVGYRFLPILRAIQDTTVFSFVVLSSLVAATNAYYVVGARQRSPSEPWPLYSAWAAIFRLGMMGDFDMFFLEGTDPIMVQSADVAAEHHPEDPEPGEDWWIVHAGFYLVSLGVTTILMNLFIGVLSTNYSMYESKARGLFACERAKTIMEIRNLNMILMEPWLPLWRLLRGQCQREQSGGNPVDQGKDDARRLLVAQRVAPQEAERSLRAVMERNFKELNDTIMHELKGLKKPESVADAPEEA